MNRNTINHKTFSLNAHQMGVVAKVLTSLQPETSNGPTVEEIANMEVTHTTWEGETLKLLVLGKRYELDFHGERLPKSFGFAGKRVLCLKREPGPLDHRGNWIHSYYTVVD